MCLHNIFDCVVAMYIYKPTHMCMYSLAIWTYYSTVVLASYRLFNVYVVVDHITTHHPIKYQATINLDVYLYSQHQFATMPVLSKCVNYGEGCAACDKEGKDNRS